ncbi:hypothetical protein [Hymenobacter sp. UYCo722]|uniref:hypothetical protein n=1 Tax=Hymenobacter sp. UYCo722 TaxID=3156335 RepID=UPI003397724D
MDYACGEVGIRAKDFWKMTWSEYQRRVNGYNQRQWHHWDRTRRVAAEVYNNMNEKPVDYRKYITLPTDDLEGEANAKLAADLAFYEMMQSRGRL